MVSRVAQTSLGARPGRANSNPRISTPVCGSELPRRHSEAFICVVKGALHSLSLSFVRTARAPFWRRKVRQARDRTTEGCSCNIYPCRVNISVSVTGQNVPVGSLVVTLFLVAMAGVRVTSPTGSFHFGQWTSCSIEVRPVRDPPERGLEVRAAGDRVRLGPTR